MLPQNNSKNTVEPTVEAIPLQESTFTVPFGGGGQDRKLSLSGNESRDSPCSKQALRVVMVWTLGRKVSVLKMRLGMHSTVDEDILIQTRKVGGGGRRWGRGPRGTSGRGGLG